MLGVDEGFAKVDEIPFDFSRRRLSVVVSHGDDKHVLICKGAVEEIFAVCTRYEVDGTDGPARRRAISRPPRRRRSRSIRTGSASWPSPTR